MSKEKAVGRNISLYPSDWEFVRQETEPLGLNTSQGVRYLLRQLQAQKKGPVSPHKPQPVVYPTQ